MSKNTYTWDLSSVALVLTCLPCFALSSFYVWDGDWPFWVVVPSLTGILLGATHLRTKTAPTHTARELNEDESS